MDFFPVYDTASDGSAADGPKKWCNPNSRNHFAFLQKYMTMALVSTGVLPIRFVGQGVGSELDEYPVLAAGQEMPLEAGMVIALEPKLIFPASGPQASKTPTWLGNRVCHS